MFALSVGSAFGQEMSDHAHWPSFRGEFGRGISQGHSLPTNWDGDSGHNVKWKTEIPGLAHSSPVIWGDRIFITSAFKEGDDELVVGLYGSIAPVDDESVFQMRVHCLDKNSGEVLWTQTAHEGVPEIKRHPKGSHAASTPAVDDEHVVAFFGSEGLYCYDHAGKLKWSKDLGTLDSGYFMVPDAQWGFASSPVIYNDRVILQCDTQGDSFLTALDINDGSEVWRTAREEVPTWGTPTVHVEEDRSQIICNGWKHIGGYDLDTGEELWKLEGGGDIPVPTPVVDEGTIYITNAHGRLAPIYAIRTSASGTLKTPNEGTANQHVRWFFARRGNYMQTPLIMDGLYYGSSDAGILTCIDTKTGELLWRERLGDGRSGFTASPVAGDGKLYFSSENGQIVVVKPGREFEIIARNEMGETTMATPAISDGVIYIRARHHLFAIEEGAGNPARDASRDRDEKQ